VPNPSLRDLNHFPVTLVLPPERSAAGGGPGGFSAHMMRQGWVSRTLSQRTRISSDCLPYVRGNNKVWNRGKPRHPQGDRGVLSN
jgi:hypothetical protein